MACYTILSNLGYYYSESFCKSKVSSTLLIGYYAMLSVSFIRSLSLIVTETSLSYKYSIFETSRCLCAVYGLLNSDPNPIFMASEPIPLCEFTEISSLFRLGLGVIYDISSVSRLKTFLRDFFSAENFSLRSYKTPDDSSYSLY